MGVVKSQHSSQISQVIVKHIIPLVLVLKKSLLRVTVHCSGHSDKIYSPKADTKLFNKD